MAGDFGAGFYVFALFVVLLLLALVAGAAYWV